MPDPETAVRAFNGLRVHLPLLGGLAANSPYWFGRDSRHGQRPRGARARLPGRGVPRAFAGWEDYSETLAEAVPRPAADDYTHVWWDVRLHPRLGTVEVREMDAQTSLADATGLSALVHCLARRGSRTTPHPSPPRRCAGRRSAPPATAWTRS